VSRDREAAQLRFAERQSLPFPLLSDRDGAVTRAYGVDGWFGVARRVTYLIGPDGVVRKVYSNVSPSGHAAEVVADLESPTPPS